MYLIVGSMCLDLVHDSVV